MAQRYPQEDYSQSSKRFSTKEERDKIKQAVKDNDVTKLEEILNDEVDVNYIEYGNGSPLHVAVRSGSEEIVKFLIEKGADVDAEKGLDGSPLHVALRSGSEEIVKLLIEKGTDVNAISLDGSPLHVAVKSGSEEIVKLLIEKGADVNAKKSLGDDTPLHVALRSGSEEIVKFLIEKGADVNAKDQFDGTPFEVAVEEGHSGVVSYFFKELHMDTSQFNEKTQKKISLLLDEAGNKETSDSHKSSANTDHLSVEDVTEGYMDGELLGSDVRVALFGAEGSGKTCLSHTLVGKDYQDTPPTKGVDHMEIAVQNAIDWRPLTNEEKLDELEQQKCLEAMFVSATKQKQRSIFAPERITTSSFASPFNELPTLPGDVPVSAPTIPAQALSLPLHSSPQTMNPQQSINSSNTICHASEAYFSVGKFKNLRAVRERYNPNKKYISIWDFAGQEIFQHTHGVFVSEEVVCLLVFDASLALHEVPERRYPDDRMPRRTVLQTICYWMELISSRLSKFSTCDKDHSVCLPTFILVGTHIDKLHHDMAIAEMIAFKKFVPLFKKELLGKPFTLHIAGSKKSNLFEKESPSLFFICNKQRVPGVIAKLKQVVMQSTSITRQTRPTRYVEVERKLLLLSTLENVYVIELKQLAEVAKSCGLPTDNEKLLQLTKYFHHKGALLHYHNVPSLSNTIILSPHWLAKLLTYVLTNLACWPIKPNLVQYAEKRQKEGLLEEELIDWSVEKFNESESPENRIATDLRGVPVVELFIKFLLIVDVTQSSLAGKKSRGKGKRLFLVPHLLPFEQLPPSKADSLKFLFYFPGHFIPDNLVDHLIVKCAQWNNDRHYDLLRLSYQWVCLDLGQYQVYEVKPVDQHHYIELTIIPDPAIPPENEMESYKKSRELITAVKGFIDDLMEEHLTAVVEKYPAACYIACPGCDELHIKLESFPSTGRCYCPTKRDHCDLSTTYYKVLSSKGDPTQSIGGVHIQQKPNQRPTMRYINMYVIPKVAAWWKNVADHLEYEIETIELIEQKHQKDVERCCDGLIRDWLTTNHGVGPKTWDTLLERLKEIEHLTAATEKIEMELKKLEIL